MKKSYKILLYLLPACLYFSYHPVITLGGNETMNFELSLALVWLVVFDLASLMVIFQQKMLRNICHIGGWRKWLWLLFPLWLSITAAVSLNATRGILTAGILWLIYLAILSMMTVAPAVITDFSEFRRVWLRWFFGASLVACAWCLLQCILDLAGAPQEVTLLCDGCVSEMFGFPHPNGWAIEPQFMGNLLLAPAIVSLWLWHSHAPQSRNIILFLVFTSAIFLTFSRGAIYALVVAMIFFTMLEITRQKSARKRHILWAWPVAAVAFLCVLNLQGLMAAVGPTNDTYATGVAKAINHLSLGAIDWRKNDTPDTSATNVTDVTDVAGVTNVTDVAKPSDGGTPNSEAASSNPSDSVTQDAIFNGYVAESTDTRLRLTGAALEIWRSSPETALFGVGLGGAGQALYSSGNSPAPKEIVQNEYASLLLETGLVGVALFIVTLALIVRAFWASPARSTLLTLFVAYAVTLFFFSGLPNALQIYLLPAVLYLTFARNPQPSTP